MERGAGRMGMKVRRRKVFEKVCCFCLLMCGRFDVVFRDVHENTEAKSGSFGATLSVMRLIWHGMAYNHPATARHTLRGALSAHQDYFQFS